jgi:hypothetical protein
MPSFESSKNNYSSRVYYYGLVINIAPYIMEMEANLVEPG